MAADRVPARSGIILNPHYKGMGNLHGSEYWTYLLPRRVGQERARVLAEARLPIGAAEASRLGLIDDHFGQDVREFAAWVKQATQSLAGDVSLPAMLAEKRKQRARDEAAMTLSIEGRNQERHPASPGTGDPVTSRESFFKDEHHFVQMQTGLGGNRIVGWLAGPTNPLSSEGVGFYWFSFRL